MGAIDTLLDDDHSKQLSPQHRHDNARASIANQLCACIHTLVICALPPIQLARCCTYPTSTSRSVFRILLVFPAKTRVDLYTDGGGERSRVPRKATKQTPLTRLTAVVTLQHRVLKGSFCGSIYAVATVLYFVKKWPEQDPRESTSTAREHQHCAPTRTPFPPSRSTEQQSRPLRLD